jgi:2,3-bisphosphoglycerate-independent phosphoglycerate mutase
VSATLKRRALLVFVDGIGFGRRGPQNPFDETPLEVLAPLGGSSHDTFPGAELRAIDATLGHPGLPQSATGQAAIFTGHDAVAVAGAHTSGYPTRALRALVEREGFLGRARERGLRAAFLNAYDARRAEHVAGVLAGREKASRRHPPSSSSVCALARGGSLRTFDDVRRGRAATFDLTGELVRAVGIDAPAVSIEQAARNVAAGAADNDVALFEMFLTDSAGHAQDTEWARDEAVRTDHFLRELFGAIDPREQLVVVTSDHGNLEDLSVRTHTRAPVPLLAFGAGAAEFTAGATSLLDVAPRLLLAAAR